MRYVFLAALALCSAAHLYYSWVDNKRGRAATKPFLLILLVLYYVFSADRLSFVLLGALVTSWLGAGPKRSMLTLCESSTFTVVTQPA